MTGKGKTVVRTGFNIIYQNPSINPFITPGAMLNAIPTGLPLLSSGVNVNTQPGSITLHSVTISPPVPWALNTPVLANYIGSTASCTAASVCTVGGVAPHLEYPMVLNWNFGVQHAITNNLTLDVSYVGNKGQHLSDYTDLNQPLPGASGTAAENARRPYTFERGVSLFWRNGPDGIDWQYLQLQCASSDPGTQRASTALPSWPHIRFLTPWMKTRPTS